MTRARSLLHAAGVFTSVLAVGFVLTAAKIAIENGETDE